MKVTDPDYASVADPDEIKIADPDKQRSFLSKAPEYILRGVEAATSIPQAAYNAFWEASKQFGKGMAGEAPKSPLEPLIETGKQAWEALKAPYRPMGTAAPERTTPSSITGVKGIPGMAMDVVLDPLLPATIGPAIATKIGKMAEPIGMASKFFETPFTNFKLTKGQLAYEEIKNASLEKQGAAEYQELVSSVTKKPVAEITPTTPITSIVESNAYQGNRITSAMKPNDVQIVAKDASGKDIGRIWYSKEEGGITVRRIDTDPAMQRQGVATQLMEEAQKTGGKVLGYDAQTEAGKLFTEGRRAKLEAKLKSYGFEKKEIDKVFNAGEDVAVDIIKSTEAAKAPLREPNWVNLGSGSEERINRALEEYYKKPITLITKKEIDHFFTKPVTGLTESEKLTAPIMAKGRQVGTEAPNAISSADLEALRPRPAGLTLADDTVSKIMENGKSTWGAAMRETNPIYWVIQHEPTGLLKKIHANMWDAQLKENAFVDAATKDFHSYMDKVPKNSPEAQTLAIWGNTYKLPPVEAMTEGLKKWEIPGATRIPITEWNEATPALREAFIGYRTQTESFADALVAKGLMQPAKRLKEYFFHMFPKEYIRQMWQDDLDIINGTINDAKASGKIIKQEKLNKLLENKAKIEGHIDNYNKTGTILYNYIPKGMDAPFLFDRSSAPREGYLLDPHKVMERYIHLASDKLYKDAVVKGVIEDMKGLSPEWKEYTKWLTKDRFLGWQAADQRDLKKFEHILTGVQFTHSLGLNFPSAIRNYTQFINHLSDAGPIATGRGLYRALSPEGKAEWAARGHAIEIPGLTFESVGAFRTVENWLSYFFSKTEAGLRRWAYATGLEKAEQLGKTGKEAITMGDNMIARNQFLYGRLGAPKVMDRYGGSVVMQFQTYTINQLNLFHDWIKHDPKRFVWWMVYSNALAGGAAGLGLDLYGALGLGTNSKHLASAFVSLLGGEAEKVVGAPWEMAKAAYKGNLEEVGVQAKEGLAAMANLEKAKRGEYWEKAKVHAKLGLPFFGYTSGNGVLPSGMAPFADLVSDLYHMKLNKTLNIETRRFIETGRALYEGKRSSTIDIPSELTGMPGVEPKTGYPVRQAPLESNEDTLKYLATPYELGMRTFIGRPMSETKVIEDRMFKQAVDDFKQRKDNEWKKDVAPLIARGTQEGMAKANEWIAKQNPAIIQHIMDTADTEVDKAWKKRNFTEAERSAIEAYENKIRIQVLYGLGFMKDKTKSLP